MLPEFLNRHLRRDLSFLPSAEGVDILRCLTLLQIGYDLISGLQLVSLLRHTSPQDQTGPLRTVSIRSDIPLHRSALLS